MSSTTGKKILSASGLLVGLFILGAILRLWNLGGSSLWLDEAISFFRGQMSLAQIIRASYGWDVHPPTYYLILHFIEKLGQSEFAIRLFSALCGIAALPVLFRWVQLQFGKKEALWAVFFQACSIFHLRYSQEACVYVLFYLVSLFVFLYFYKACESGKRRHWFLWACFSILNFYIHYYSLVLLASQILYFIVPVVFQRIRKQKIKKISDFILSSCTIFAGCLPQVFFFINQATSKIETSTSFWQVSNPLQFGLIFLRNQVNPFSLSYSFLDRGLKYLFLIIFIFAIGIWWKKIKETAYPISILFLSILLGWISSFFIYFPGTFRCLIFLNAPFCVLLGVSAVSISEHLESRMSQIFERTGKEKLFIMVLLLMLFGSIQVFLLTEYYQTHQKPDWRKSLSQITEIGNSEDVVIPIPGYSDYVSRYYLLRKENAPQVIRINDLTISIMDSLKAQHEKVFFTTDGHPSDSSHRDAVDQWLEDHARRIWVDKHFHRSAIWLASKDDNNPPSFIKEKRLDF